MFGAPPNPYARDREATAMHAKEIIEGLLLALIFTSGGMLLPDALRYLKTRTVKLRTM
jgi:hypothetical protein